MRLATLVVSAALLILAVAYWFAADALPVSRLAGQVGADGLPKLLGLALGGFSLLLAGQTLLEMRRASAAAPKNAQEKEKRDPFPGTLRGHLRALGLIGIGIGYLLVLPHLGYMVSSGLLLAATATYSGLKFSRATLLFAVLGAVVFYLIFVKILQIPLPPGFWPSLLG